MEKPQGKATPGPRMGGTGRAGAPAAPGMSGGRQGAWLRLRDVPLPAAGARSARRASPTPSRSPLTCEGRAGLGQAGTPARSWRCSPWTQSGCRGSRGKSQRPACWPAPGWGRGPAPRSWPSSPTLGPGRSLLLRGGHDIEDAVALCLVLVPQGLQLFLPPAKPHSTRQAFPASTVPEA